MDERRFLGVVEVDSGTLLVGDPTYVLPSRSRGVAGIDYEEVERSNGSEPAMQLGDRPVLLLTRFGGDGTYPVIGEFEDGTLSRITVEFAEPLDDD